MNEDCTYICRLCLTQCEFPFSLFVGNIIHQIESLTSIRITKNDKLPKHCCDTCLANIYLSYKFRQRIIESDKLLNRLVSSEMAIIEETKQSPSFEIMYLDDNVETEECKLEDGKIDNVETEECNLDDIKIEDAFKKEDIFMEHNIQEVDLTNSDNKDVECEQDNSEAGELQLENDFLNQHTAYQKNKREINFKCKECELECYSKMHLQRHMVKHNLRMCPVCSVMMRKDNLKKHMEIHQDSPEICDICGKKAKNKESLRGHINYYHKNKSSIQCERCSKEFKCKAQYNVHFRQVHLDIRNHQCDTCGKNFYTNYSLIKHINMTHKRARPYVCQYCKKGFSSPHARKVHIRIHTNETPYRCDICAAGFTQKVCLSTHLKNKHSVIH